MVYDDGPRNHFAIIGRVDGIRTSDFWGSGNSSVCAYWFCAQ